VVGAACAIGVLIGIVNGSLVAFLRIPSIVVTLAMMIALREGLRWATEGAWIQDLPVSYQWLGLGPRGYPFVVLAVVIGLQAAFGWTDNHLHRFEIGGLDYGPIDPEEDVSIRRTFDSSGVRLHDFALRYGRPVEFLYEYDFGDSWIHVLTLNTAQRDPAARYPRCTGGSRGGPPEDSGGAPGYAEFLEAWRDPAHPGHKEMRRWAGRRFDPEHFDLETVNKAIRAAIRGGNGAAARRH